MYSTEYMCVYICAWISIRKEFEVLGDFYFVK